jgi:hypothetical protein
MAFITIETIRKGPKAAPKRIELNPKPSGIP